MVSNTWTLRTVPNSDYETNIFGYDVVLDRPISADNDPTRVVSGFRTITPGGKEVILKGQQYSYNGKPLFMEMTLSDTLVLTNDPESNYFVTEASLIDPSGWITNPIINLRPGDFCSFAGPFPTAQQTACDVQNFLNLPVARTLLPSNIRESMSLFDVRQLTAEDAMPQFEVTGDYIYALQQYLFPVYPVEHIGGYFVPEDSPLLDELYPNTSAAP